MQSDRNKILTEVDRNRLDTMIVRSLEMLGDPLCGRFRELDEVVSHATVVSEREISPDVITMNSRFTVRELSTGKSETSTLVYEGDSALFDTSVSVLSPLGTQLLGSRAGDVIEWGPPGCVRRLRIERVDSQPESAGNYVL